MNFAERARGLVSAAPYFALPLQNFYNSPRYRMYRILFRLLVKN